MSTPSSSRSYAPLSPARSVGWSGITLVVMGYVVLLALELALVGIFPDLGARLSRVAEGVITLPLGFSAVLLVVEALILFGWLHLHPRDVGLVRARVLGGIAVYLGVWIVYQGVFVALDALSHRPITLESFWSQPASYLAVLGVVLTYSLGIALSEEIVFRGFLVLQVWQTLCPRFRPWVGLVVTLGISQGIFMVIHIPAVLSEGQGPLGLVLRLAAIFVLGTLLALLFLQTQNLFIAVAVHGLADGAIPLVHQTVLQDTSWLALVAAIVLLLSWPVVTGYHGLRQGVGQNIEPESKTALPAFSKNSTLSKTGADQ
jgi:membrane protease YdiL (CAAX protease family)